MQATRIIAIRHGETAWNAENRIQGQLDIALNATGQWQAQQVARALADEPIALVYTSDLARALATAQAIAQQNHGLLEREVQLRPGLRERAFGIFEGHTYTAIEARWPEESLRWKQREPHFAPPGGETPEQLMARVSAALNALAAPHMGQQIVLVAHGGVLDMLYRLATRQDVRAPRTWDLRNTAINRLLWTPDALTLVGWADTHHLDEAARDESGA